MPEKDIIVFDLETQKEFAEVGRNHPELLKVSVLGAYSYNEDKYHIFEESELKKFEELINGAGALIGFNIKSFDIPVLQPYLSVDLNKFAILDLMNDVESAAGFRVSLDNLSRTTLGLAKSADGLAALEWFRQGRIQEVKDYCLKDVEVTRKLYEFGKENGRVKFFSRSAFSEITLPVNWRVLSKKEVKEDQEKDRQPTLL
ncbi:MAG: ribonuclease H-like domain-containing protein [Patescibacteria group bacterium]